MFVRENQHISKGVGKRLFLSVLVTYLLLLIAAISLPVFGYFYSIRQSQQEMEALQISYLGQIQREFDLRLNSIFKINKFLASYPLTKSISEMDEEQVSNQTFYHSLNEVIVEQNTLLGNDGQTVIYFAHSDSVLTGEYRYRSENLDAYTKQLGLSPAEFRVFLSEGAATGSLRILHPGTAEAELTYLVPVYDENFQKVGTVMTRLSMSLLQKELNVSSWAEGSVCHMENGEEVFYIDNGGFANTASEVPDYSQVPLDATPVKNQIQGEDFITVGLRSSVNTWKYYFSIPSQEFFRSNMFYLVWFCATLVASLFSGVTLSLVFSRHFSKPIHSILNSLSLDTSVAYPEAMHSLEHALSTYKEELSANRNQLFQSSRQKKAGFIWGLCTGRISPGDSASEVEKYHLVLEGVPLYLISFRYTGMEKSVFCQNGTIDVDMLLYASCNVIEEMLCSQRGAAISHDVQTYCLYQPPQKVARDTLREKLEEIRNFHRDTLHTDLQIFCAGYCSSYADLPEMLFRVEEMAHYKAFWNEEVPDILFYGEINDLTDLRGSYAYASAEKRFVNLLSIKDYEGAHQVLMESLNTGIPKDINRFRIERFKVFGLISSLMESMLSELPEGLAPEEQEQIRIQMKELLTEKSFNDLRKKVDKLFEYIITHNKKNSTPEAPPWVWKVRDYIETYYSDPQLDVSLLAKEFSVNVSHLSRTYKKTMSIGVLDNIHMIRIARAKELLDQGCTVQQASSQVGYLESRALIRTFKRYEGITPGQYQESGQHKESIS